MEPCERERLHPAEHQKSATAFAHETLKQAQDAGWSHLEFAHRLLGGLANQRRERAVERPEWIGEEVTGDRRYYNADLSRHPFSRW